AGSRRKKVRDWSPELPRDNRALGVDAVPSRRRLPPTRGTESVPIRLPPIAAHRSGVQVADAAGEGVEGRDSLLRDFATSFGDRVAQAEEDHRIRCSSNQGEGDTSLP